MLTRLKTLLGKNLKIVVGYLQKKPPEHLQTIMIVLVLFVFVCFGLYHAEAIITILRVLHSLFKSTPVFAEGEDKEETPPKPASRS